MRFTSAVALAAAVAPLSVSATGRLGFALGVRTADADCKTKDDYLADFKVLQGTGTNLVRTYAAVDGGSPKVKCYILGDLLQAAQEFSLSSKTTMKVLIGLWADTQDAFEADLGEAAKYASQYSDYIYGYTVGSEGLYRYQQDKTTGYTASDLLDRIGQTTAKLGSDIKIGTADSWNKYQDGTADPLIPHLNLILVNAFGYWQSQDISNASHTYLDDLSQAYGHIQDVAGSTDSIELWTGETGWPTDGGSNYHDDAYSTTAVAGTQNAQTFFKEGVCAALDWNFDVFYFEAFNEPWKPASKGLGGQDGDETHWGAFDKDRNQVIPDLTCSYSS